jgi:hypothetical protein
MVLAVARRLRLLGLGLLAQVVLNLVDGDHPIGSLPMGQVGKVTLLLLEQITQYFVAVARLGIRGFFLAVIPISMMRQVDQAIARPTTNRLQA